jgi:hypothetical protein
LTDTTVIVKTIGRPSLKAAVKSARREGFKVIVVSDGQKVSAQGASRIVKLGRQWGFYGGMCTNVGAAVAETEFITLLDDDDVFIEGAGDIIRRKLKEKPDVDVWIGGVQFEQPITIYNTETGEPRFSSTDIAIRPEMGIIPGNVSMPTYRCTVLSKVPFKNVIPEKQANLSDFFHVQACAKLDFKVDWFGEVLYIVRPDLGGVNGEGSV